jgi:hypothetical protein
VDLLANAALTPLAFRPSNVGTTFAASLVFPTQHFSETYPTVATGGRSSARLDNAGHDLFKGADGNLFVFFLSQ